MSTSSPMDAASQLFMKRRRAFVACANCRKRKIKCATLSDGDCRPCTRCAAKGLKCEYLAVDESSPQPTTVACINCRKSKIKCATVTDGNCRPCTQCVHKGLRCEYYDPNDYSFRSSTSQGDDPAGGSWHEWVPEPSEYIMDDRGGWTPKPITPPSAGIDRFMPSSSRGMSHNQPQPGGSRHSRPPQVHPTTMPPVPSRALSPYHSSPYPSAHLPTEFTPAQNHFNASPQYYHGATPDLGGAPSFVNPAFLNQSNGGTYVPPAGRHVPYPSTWPNMIQDLHAPYQDPNADFNHR